MTLKRQVEEYFQSIQDLTGDTLYFDELPKIQATKSAVRRNSTQNSVDSFEKSMPVKPQDTTSNAINKPIIKPSDSLEKVMPDKKSKLSTTVDKKIDLFDVDSLAELESKISTCRYCVLGDTRTNVVFGSGDPNANLMIIGEAPGAEEDKQGKPFVGRAGKLLTNILEAIHFSREEVYIANICKCRPPGNRRPSTEEVAFCEQYLHKQIEFIKPKFILALGLTAADTLFKKSHKMADIRGKIFDYCGIPTMVTYHPAALLRNPNWKLPVWEDVKRLRSMYDEAIAE